MKFLLPNNGAIELTEIACALILGILVNVMVNLKKKPEQVANQEEGK